MHMSGESERRIQPRAEIKWPVTLLSTQAKIDGEIQNVSPSGAFVSCKEPPPVEGSFFVIIKPPDRQTLSVAGKVIWSTILEPKEGDSSLGIGIQFTNMTPGDREFLNNLVTLHYKEKISRKVDKKEESSSQ